MKTEKQISEWLKDKPWYNDFILNIESAGNSDIGIVNGSLLRETIGKAFTWHKTSQGDTFWDAIDKEFIDWYDKDEKLEKPLKKNTASVKNDIVDDKVMMDLLPWRELEEIAKVYTAGAKKYGPNKWQGLPNGYQRYKGAMLRHLTELEKGNDVDPDTGCLHAAQVAWNAIAMLHCKMEEYKNSPIKDMGEISDGYHTFNELYRYRKLYNAAFFNELAKDGEIKVCKSKRHHDGEKCFGGGWFIVMAELPTGQVSNHYELKDWDLFDVPEVEVAWEWDGHTPNEAANRIESYLHGNGLNKK